MSFIDIQGYEGLYQIDINGIIKSTKRKGTKDPILKLLEGRNGYYSVQLRNKGNDKKMTLHRLLAIHFIPNPESLPMVDHINRDRKDNRIENLRWASASLNGQNRQRNGCISIDRRTINGKTYEYFRVFYTPFNEKRISKRFKLEMDAKLYLEELLEKYPN